MRTALVLLLVLAIAAIPGSLVPAAQGRPERRHPVARRQPRLCPVLDGLRLFDVYLSPWFSAIYLLLFVSLVGCVIPRIKHHAKALMRARRARPPALQRLEDYEKRTVEARTGRMPRPGIRVHRPRGEAAEAAPGTGSSGTTRAAPGRFRPSAATCARPATAVPHRPRRRADHGRLRRRLLVHRSARGGRGRDLREHAHRLRLDEPRTFVERRRPRSLRDAPRLVRGDLPGLRTSRDPVRPAIRCQRQRRASPMGRPLGRRQGQPAVGVADDERLSVR